MGWIENSEERHRWEAGPVWLEFTWKGDRWVHALGASPDGSLPRADSVEVDPNLADPERVVSPAYQQAHHEAGADGSEHLLLVGQSGPHHFSAAFTIRLAGRETTLDVDVADRCRTTIQGLAATYTITPGRPPDDAEPTRGLVWRGPNGDLSLEVEPPATLAIESPGYGNALLVQATARLDLASHTQRFRYRWRWSTGPE